LHAFEPDAWRDFFVTTGSIGAAIAGLVFVAISINLREILRSPSIVGRGAEAVLLLLSIAAVAIVGVWPADRVVVGAALFLVGAVTWITLLTIVGRRDSGIGASTRQHGARLILGQLATLPTILAGASLAIGVGPGLNVLVPGALFSLVAGVVGAWVLLVEILR
jgi:modulator of FtsH protease